MWPIVQSGPMVSGNPRSVWQMQPSWTFAPRPTTIGSLSPRRTALNQTEAPGSSTTLPINRAPGATQASVGDHAPQQFGGREPVAQSRVQLFGDAEAHVEADQIGRAQRAHGMPVPEARDDLLHPPSNWVEPELKPLRNARKAMGW